MPFLRKQNQRTNISSFVVSAYSVISLSLAWKFCLGLHTKILCPFSTSRTGITHWIMKYAAGIVQWSFRGQFGYSSWIPCELLFLACGANIVYRETYLVQTTQTSSQWYSYSARKGVWWFWQNFSYPSVCYSSEHSESKLLDGLPTSNLDCETDLAKFDKLAARSVMCSNKSLQQREFVMEWLCIKLHYAMLTSSPSNFLKSSMQEKGHG